MSQITPRGLRNCNPLNIKHGSQWKGLRNIQSDPTFCQFETMAYGWRAALILMRNYITGFGGTRRQYNTPEKIISRWAPPMENMTSRYCSIVCEETGLHRMEVIKWKERDKVCALVLAMAWVECGIRFDIEDVKSAYDLLR